MPRAGMKTADPVESLRHPPVLDPVTAGRRIHRAIGLFLERDVRRPQALEVLSLARDLVKEPGLPVPHQQSAIQRLATATASYFRCFALDDRWSYLGSEVAADSCRFDFVFKRDAGVLVDELKAGRFADVVERKLADEQIKRQLAAGVAMWGDNFFGIRVLFLAAPKRSYLARPDGTQVLLQWGESQ